MNYRGEDVLDLCILSSWEAGGIDVEERAAWYDEEASWARAGTAPPAESQVDRSYGRFLNGSLRYNIQQLLA